MDYVFGNAECSSGCESGWTLYLDHSSISPYNQEHDYLDERRSRVFGTQVKGLEQEEEEREDEDLSMVSDASSGPPHFHEEGGYGGHDNSVHYQNDASLSRKRNKSKDNRRRKVQDQSSLLDDTASSPLFDFANKSFVLTRSQPSVENVMEYSQGYSSTQFEVSRPYQEHYDFFQSSQSPNKLQQNQWFEGKMW